MKRDNFPSTIWWTHSIHTQFKLKGSLQRIFHILIEKIKSLPDIRHIICMLKMAQQEGPTIITILSFPFPFMSCKQISMVPRAIKEKALLIYTNGAM